VLVFGVSLSRLIVEFDHHAGFIANDLMYGAVVCRLCYYRKPDALPEAGDIEGQAAF